MKWPSGDQKGGENAPTVSSFRSEPSAFRVKIRESSVVTASLLPSGDHDQPSNDKLASLNAVR